MARAKAATRHYRLFVDQELASGLTLAVDKDDSHYLIRVLRLKAGDRVGLVNGAYGEWTGRIVDANAKAVVFEIEALVRAAAPCPPLSLAFAPLRKERLEWLIEKGTELGVTQFQPIITDYTQHERFRADRLERIAKEAAEQCERLDLPTIAEPLAFDGWLKALERPVAVALERFEQHEHYEGAKPDQLLIGPEGGFSPKERDSLLAHPRVQPISLGARLLRAETAAVVGLALLALDSSAPNP